MGNKQHRKHPGTVRQTRTTKASDTQLAALREVALAMGSIQDLHATLTLIAQKALSVLCTDVLVIFLVNEADRTLDPVVATTPLGDGAVRRLEKAYGQPLASIKFPLEPGKALIVDAALDCKPRLGLDPLSLKEITRYEGVRPLLDALEAMFGRKTISIAPLQARGKAVGVMVFLSSKKVSHSEEDLINAFASLTAVAIDNSRIYQRLKSFNSQVVDTLVTTIELRDPFTAGHSEGVTRYALAIAKKMGLPPDNIEALSSAGPLHDLGKIGVPDTVLNKPSLLTSAESVLNEAHPIIATDIVSKIGSLAHLIPIIRHHHERYDGTGYPDGLKGEEIPLLARILAVADGFEAMTAHRSYRSSMTWERATEELKTGAGKQWDPKVANAFLDFLEEEGAPPTRGSAQEAPIQ